MASGSGSIGGRRMRLREATAATHSRLDAFIESAGFLSNRNAYRDYVAATWRARRPLERRLDDSGAVEIYPDWPSRRIADALVADLADLAAPLPAETSARSGGASVPEILGTLYVLEGSALGARILGKRVGTLGVGPSKGARHIAVQTSDPRAWGRFVEALDGAPMSDADEEICIEAAHAAFEDFERSYREAGPSR